MSYKHICLSRGQKFTCNILEDFPNNVLDGCQISKCMGSGTSYVLHIAASCMTPASVT